MPGYFFRADNFFDAINILKKIFSESLFNKIEIYNNKIILIFFLIGLFLTIEWLQRTKKHGLELDEIKLSKPITWSIYVIIIFLIFVMKGDQQEFIYFQF